MSTSAYHPRYWQTDNLYNRAQMSTQAVVRLSPEPASRFTYEFLAHPPSPRTRSVEPLPPTPTVRATVRRPRRRSSTISSWTTSGSHAFAPVNSPAASRRPSLVRTPRSARRYSATFHSSPTLPHTHTADLHALGYTSAIIQLPKTPRTAAPCLPPSYFPPDFNGDHINMKFTLDAAPRPREGSTSVHASSSTPAKRKGLMRFLRPGQRPRSTMKPPPAHWQAPSRPARASSPPPSPTATDAFRIAHQKRVHYARNGALPLPVESEVALMQFVDGGSRADAVARLGVAPYTDAAGVVYSDETEAAECLPLLLAPEDTGDETHSDVFAFAPSSPLPSPLAHRTPPMFTSPATSTQAIFVASSPRPRTLLSVPARASGGDAGTAAYLHLTFDPSSVSAARGRARRRRPTPLTVPTCLRPTVVIGFDDSFVPSCGAVSEASVKASVVRDAEMEFRGKRAMRRE